MCGGGCWGIDDVVGGGTVDRYGGWRYGNSRCFHRRVVVIVDWNEQSYQLIWYRVRVRIRERMREIH